ncbi:MAG TPA: hypothetical protein VNK95_02415 [Caldilineaceae bacterium]|nr:hypothetical protein [Caldilineaceae bacterium]
MALGQILSQSLARHEPRHKQGIAPAMRSAAPSGGMLSRNLSRLISAAVVSPRFCQLLLSDPAAALAAGYNGESFLLTPAEYEVVTSLRVNSIRDFAVQLLHMLQSATGEAALYAPEAQADFRFAEVGTQ